MPPRQILQHQLCQSLATHLPHLRATTPPVLAGLAVGLSFAEGISLPAIAADAPFTADLHATITRFHRFLQHPQATRQACWDPLLPDLLAAETSTDVTLIFDLTNHADRFTSLVIGLAHHQRAVPLTWHVVAAQARWRDQFAPTVREMVQTIAAALPPGRTVTLLADAGLTSPFLVDLCQSVGWHWVFRLSVTPNGQYLFRCPDGREQRIAAWLPDPATPTRRRTRCWEGQVFKGAGWRDAWVTIHAHPDHAAPWVLISDRPGGPAAVKHYRRRMQIEAMFADWKGRGWQLVRSRLREPRRMAALLIGVALAHWHLMALGARVVRSGQRHRYDRRDRRTWSLLRLGRWEQRRRERACRQLAAWQLGHWADALRRETVWQ